MNIPHLLFAGLALLPQDPPASAPPAAQETPPAQDAPAANAEAADDVPIPGSGPGLGREEMWRAPTAEDWAKPVLIEWERTWEDAVAVSERTGKPILVCINMDGEIASEHYAGIRYRDPQVARIFQDYVCVVASVYRHNPRDFDEQGRRIECPRFHGVTCGEHIAMEPVVYEKYLDDRRISPRHVMVELDGSEVYDVYYAFDTKSVFQRIRKGIVERELEPYPEAPDDLSLYDRVASPAARDREIVEQAYVVGSRQLRRDLLTQAIEVGPAAPVDLLRLAIFGLDGDLSRMAREALAKSNAPGAVDLIAEALRVPLAKEEREALIAALERLGESDEKARTMAVVYRGLEGGSESVDASTWARRLAQSGPVERAPGIDALTSKLDYTAATADARPEDPTTRIEMAEAYLAMAVDPETARSLSADRRQGERFSKFLFQDALRSVQEAEEMGAKGWRVDAAMGLASYYLGDMPTADARAEKAVAALPEGEASWHAMAVLGLFAEARQRQIREKLRAGEDWPREWVADVHSTYQVLAQHPLGTEEQVIAHHDFLKRFRANERAYEALDRGLEKFPDSAQLHARLRGRILEQVGVGGLVSTYERLLAKEDAPQNMPWFAALAALYAAEYRARAAEDAEAIAAYTQSIEWWEAAIAANENSRDSSNHYAALSLMGRGRLRMNSGELAPALADMVASFERRPLSANAVDGLGHYGTANARMLISKLEQAGDADGASRMKAALDALPPQALLAPDFELEQPRDDGRGPVRERRRGLRPRSATPGAEGGR